MSLKKRSFSLAGHRTSVALEAEFWAVLDQSMQGSSLAALVAKVDAQRVAHGTPKALKKLEAAKLEQASERLVGHRLEVSRDDN